MPLKKENTHPGGEGGQNTQSVCVQYVLVRHAKSERSERYRRYCKKGDVTDDGDVTSADCLKKPGRVWPYISP